MEVPTKKKKEKIFREPVTDKDMIRLEVIHSTALSSVLLVLLQLG
jgi:hypothetical protein